MKFFSLFIFLFVTNICISQVSQYTWLVGGAGSFYKYSSEYNSELYNNVHKGMNINIEASVGNFLVEKLAVGLRPSFYTNTFKAYENGIQTGYGSSSSGILVGPFCRYYLMKDERVVNVFADASYVLGKNYFKSATKSSGKANSFTIAGGVEIFFNSSVGIEVQLGYKTKYEDIKKDLPSSYVDKRNGLFIAAGFQLHLEKL